MLKLSFASKIIISVISIEIIFITIRAVLSFNTQQALSYDLINEKVETNTQLFSQIIRDPLVLNDLATLDNRVKNFISGKNVISAEIIDTENRSVSYNSENKKINFNTLPKDKNNLIHIDDRIYEMSSLPISFEGESVGKVVVVYELTDVYRILEKDKQLKYLFILLEIILSAIVLYWIVHKLTQKLSKLTIMASNITPSHNLEDRIKDKKSDEISELIDTFTIMEKRINENTKMLVDAKEEAERLASIKAEFLASMSHEIRTPMNGVLGMIELLERTKLDDKQAHYAHIAHSSASSLLALINDILDFSKVDAGKMDLEMIEFDLMKELEDFVEYIGFKAKEKHLELILDTSLLKTQYIVTDPGRLRQILGNLVTNAVKFTDVGKIYIDVSSQDVDESHTRLSFNVTDTGIGIPQSSIGGLFGMFTQVDSSTTRKYGGTGLGLSIVKKLSELMGGSVSVTSEVDRGSVFSFNILVGIGKNKSVAIPVQDTEGPDVVTENNTTLENISWPSNTRILLVEDNTTNQIVANGMLEMIGLYADVAANGIEAIEAVRTSNDTQPYTIVLMDCQMPEMNGYDATRAIRSGKAGEENKHLPIIAMTANAMQGDREKCTNAGMDDYIAKPINLPILKSTLIKWIFNVEASESLSGDESLTQQTDLPLWDEADALSRLGNNKALLNKIIESFMVDGLKSLASLRTSLEENNSENAQLHAHSLKGSAGNVGALKLQEFSKHLEEAAKNKNINEVKAGLEECENILNDTLKIFAVHLAKELKRA